MLPQDSDNHSSGRTVLISILGEMVQPNQGWAWTSTLIKACSTLGIGDTNVRQALSRLADSGLITSERHGRRAKWLLTPSANDRLSAGAERIYGFAGPHGDWSGTWLVLLASVPESQRQDRRRLRTLLEFEGFGFPAPGIAISPHVDREETLRRILAEFSIDDALVFRATASELTRSRTIIDRAWDLDPLEERYNAFVERYRSARPEGGSESFAALIRLVHEWRQFPSLDPEIPIELTPWAGEEAAQVFRQKRAHWRPEAESWYLSLR